MSRKLVSIQEANEFLGVAPQTLRRWEREGKLLFDERTAGRQRRYDPALLRPDQFYASEAASRTIAYACVFSIEQKDELERQKQLLERYCARQGWTFADITHLGSGLNYHKKGLKRLLDAIIDGQVGRLDITHKDQLTGFGAELEFAICQTKGVEVLILNQGEETAFEEDLAKEVLGSIPMFSAWLQVAAQARPRNCLLASKKPWRNLRAMIVAASNLC